MDALKLVPQIFFDAIGRVLPGGVALALWFIWVPGSSKIWIKLLSASQGLSVGKESSSLFAATSLVVCAYAVGHLISPLTKLVQRTGEWLDPKFKKTVPDSASSKSQSAKYDWLRVHAPDAGALCAKLRAEFTMYNSLAAVFLMAFCASPLLLPAPPLMVQLGFVLLTLGMAYRGREGAETFAKSVGSFYTAATERPIKPHTPFRVSKPAKRQDEA